MRTLVKSNVIKFEQSFKYHLNIQFLRDFRRTRQSVDSISARDRYQK